MRFRVLVTASIKWKYLKDDLLVLNAKALQIKCLKLQHHYFQAQTQYKSQLLEWAQEEDYYLIIITELELRT